MLDLIQQIYNNLINLNHIVIIIFIHLQFQNKHLHNLDLFLQQVYSI